MNIYGKDFKHDFRQSFQHENWGIFKHQFGKKFDLPTRILGFRRMNFGKNLWQNFL